MIFPLEIFFLMFATVFFSGEKQGKENNPGEKKGIHLWNLWNKQTKKNRHQQV